MQTVNTESARVYLNCIINVVLCCTFHQIYSCSKRIEDIQLQHYSWNLGYNGDIAFLT